MPNKLNHIEKLTALTYKLLDNQSTYKELTTALDEFLALCCHASDILPSLSYSAHAGDTELQQGIAINPEAAAQCVKDYRRTVAFIRGLYAAIQNNLKDSADRSIRLLYAGCGPYAAILMPLLSVIKPKNVDIHLLDIHDESLESVHQLLDYFGFNNFTVSYYCEDACEFQPSISFDIILAETMQKALEQEPQVMVTANLTTLLNPNGTFLPEQIAVDLCIRDKGSNTTKTRVKTMFELAANHQCRTLIHGSLQHNDPKIQLGTVVIPKLFNSHSHELVLTTNIQIYKDIYLTNNEAEISLVTEVYDLRHAHAYEHWQAYYLLGTYPRFGFTLVSV